MRRARKERKRTFVELMIGVALIFLGVVFFFVPFVPGIVLVIAGLAFLGVIHFKHKKQLPPSRRV